MNMEEIGCPNCGAVVKEEIVTDDKNEKSETPWFNVANCEICGHVYGEFEKLILSYS
jgi:uncharacterized Zn finger protein